VIDVTMPQMGVSVAEGTVVEWKKQPGDRVEADEMICSISTDKIDTDVESPAGGWVAELLVEVGATVEVGVVLARIATDAPPDEAHGASNGAEASASAITTEAGAALEAPGEAGELKGDEAIERPDSVTERTPTPSRGGPRRYSPVVLRVAAEHAVDLEEVTGTGREGRVRKQDVMAFLENGGGGAAAAGEPPMHIESPYKPDEAVTRKPRPSRIGRAEAPGDAPAGEPLSRMRQMIGRAMVDSLQTAATCTTIIEADMTGIARDRERTGMTWLPYVARATIEALAEYPALNATLEGDRLTTHAEVHLGVAVALGDDGLIVPVVRVSAPDVPIPFSPPLERAVLPQSDDVKEACRELLAY